MQEVEETYLILLVNRISIYKYAYLKSSWTLIQFMYLCYMLFPIPVEVGR